MYLLSWLKDNGMNIDTLKVTDLIFGKFDTKDDLQLITFCY